jgi:hypothetical protein
MKLVPTKNYKKLYKTLKKSTTSIPITIEMKNTNYYDCLHCDHVEITNDSVISTTTVGLPNDIINYILEFIPINTRLSILKKIYNTKFLKNKLEKMNVKTLYKCALLAKKIYVVSYSHLYSNFDNCNVWILDDLSKEEINKYPYYYKDQFITMIISAIKHNRKIYKEKKIKIRIPIRTPIRTPISIGIDHHGMVIFIFTSFLAGEKIIIKYENYKDIPNFEKMLFKMYSQVILM